LVTDEGEPGDIFFGTGDGQANLVGLGNFLMRCRVLIGKFDGGDLLHFMGQGGIRHGGEHGMGYRDGFGMGCVWAVEVDWMDG
jgi:hypothetical protein